LRNISKNPSDLPGQLRRTTLRIFSCTPHSASVERVNSAMKLIDTNLRQRLLHKNMWVLTFITTNLRTKKEMKEMALGDSSAYFRMQATVLDRIEKCPNVDPCILNFDEADKEELTFV